MLAILNFTLKTGDPLNPQEFDSVLKQPSAIRYEYFIKKVADYEEVWGLFDDGWATADDGQGNLCIPFFPREEFAKHCAAAEWSRYKPKSIDLHHFIDAWLVGMKKDNVKASVFPTNTNTAIIEIDILLRDLHTELEKYA